MPINFPNSPILNEQYTYDNKTWEWNGTYWEVYSALTSYITSAYTVGDGISDISGVTGGNITLKSFSGVNITIVDGGDKLTFSGSPQQNVSGLYLPLSGGTVTGNTIFTSGLTASTLTSNGSITASTSIARGNYLQPTLVAAANNDVLVGLEINPTFTNGAFTGVKNNWINLVGNASINFTNQVYLKRGDVDVLFASSVETQLKTVSSSAPLKFFVGSTSQYAQFFATTGNLLLQNGGTFTDAGFRLDVNGTTRVQGEANVSFLTLAGNTAVNNSGSVMILGASGAWSAVRVPRYFETTGTISASTSIARGTYLNQTLVATANNDVLVGLDIAPTFTTGAFSGVIGYGLYVRSNIATTPNTSIRLGIGSTGSTSEFVSFGGGRNYIGFDSSLGGAVIGSVSTRSISFGLGNEGSTTVYGRFHATTGNFTLQNGGTFTDAGYRLDVVGSDARINGVRVGLGGGSDTLSTAVGASALNVNTSGISNTAIGYLTLSVNISGNNNTALGSSALRFSTQANNTAIGSTSLLNLSSGSNNTALGRNSARYIADGSTSLTIASQSVFIGADSRPLANSQTNQIVIGYDAIGLGSNSVVLGNSGITKTALQGNILIGTTTDDGYKLDVSGTTMLRGIVYGVGSGGVPIQLLTTVGTGTAVVGGNTATPIRVQAQNIQLYVGSTQVGYFHPTTGNFTLQNGSTFTDAGFRLDVQGQARVTGNSFLAATFINVISAQTSAILQADSTSRGFLPPRMTSTQRDAISSPATGLTVYQTTDNYLSLYNGVNWQNIVSPNSNGNVLIGKTTDSGQKLQVSGDTLISGGLTANTISATVKMFDIEHPTKDGLRLRHGNLEGPENGVYFRGTIVNQKEIILPDYWEGLVDESSITVSLTPIGFFQSLFVVSKSNKKIIIDNNEDKNHFDFVIYGERKDINKLIIEYKK